MSDPGNRIPCPHCQAANLPSSVTCWQCGQPLNAQEGGETPPAGTAGTPNSQDVQSTPSTPGPIPPPVSAAPPARSNGDTSIFIILGFVFSALGLIPSCCGWPFIIAGVVMGIIAFSKGNKVGLWVIGASILALVLNLVVVAYFYHNMMNSGSFPGGPQFPFPGSPTPHGSGPFGPNANPVPHVNPVPHATPAPH